MAKLKITIFGTWLTSKIIKKLKKYQVPKIVFCNIHCLIKLASSGGFVGGDTLWGVLGGAFFLENLGAPRPPEISRKRSKPIETLGATETWFSLVFLIFN